MKTLVIGSRGLIGSAIQRSICVSKDLFLSGTTVNWNDVSRAQLDLLVILNEFKDFVGNDRWAVFWTAGKGHLGSTSSSVQLEEQLFSFVASSVAAWGRSDGLITLSSSAGAIWSEAEPGLISESTKASGMSQYAQSKLRLEATLRELCKETGLRGLIARLSSIYGVNQDLQKPQGLISRLCVASIARKPAEIYVPVETTRNYLYADDAAGMMLNAVEQLAGETGTDGECVLRVFCSRDNHSVATICAAVETVTRRKLLLTTKKSTGFVQPLKIKKVLKIKRWRLLVLKKNLSNFNNFLAKIKLP